MKRKLLVASIIISLFVFAIYELASFSLLGDPEIIFVSSKLSPDKRYMAVVSLYGAGATSSTYSRVHIKTNDESTGKDDDYVFMIKHETIIDIRWLDNKTLLINHYPDEIAVAKTKWRDVKIEYRVSENGKE